MQAPSKVHVLFGGMVFVGVVLLGVAVMSTPEVALATLSLLAAAVVITELLQVTGDEDSLDPDGDNTFSFSSGIHIAAILLVGPWAAALVAVFGVLVVDSVRGTPWRRIGFNASVFAIAAAASGFAFQLTGGTPADIRLPSDFFPLLVLVVAYYTANMLPVSGIIASTTGFPFWRLARDKAVHMLPSTAGEASLGIGVALLALHEPWATIVLMPLALAVYQARARLAALRTETAQALETFANVVDERDPSTYRHSMRVAEHVRRLAHGLGLPSSEIARLRWAGRLHDLGKVAVDASVLGKPGKLSEEEWATMRRHPRLSARLLRRFRFAAEEARAVEYHHERYDGKGYYGVGAREMPLASYFLTVADTYDAMTSDRSYRAALPKEVALAEIEAGSGSQFHPAVAKAFVALERGLDPKSVLSPEERAELRRLSLRGRRDVPVLRQIPSLAARRPQLLVTAGLVLALASIGLGFLWPAAGGATLAICGLVSLGRSRMRSGVITSSLRAPHADTECTEVVFQEVVNRIAVVSHLRWAGLVSWNEPGLSGSIELSWEGGSTGPNETALTSWFVREADSGDLLVAAAAGVGLDGVLVALPLRRDSSIAGYLVLALAHAFPRHLELALRRCVEDFARLLMKSPLEEDEAEPTRLALVS